MTLEELYQDAKASSLDIGEHLKTLRGLAFWCKHVTEFGVRAGCSTAALLAGLADSVDDGGGKLMSYDIQPFIRQEEFEQAARAEGVEFCFYQRDDLAITIEPTDLLFIDTVHTYRQLDAELRKHEEWVKRWIVLHDTYTDDYKDSPGSSGKDMWIAVLKLCAKGHWRIQDDDARQFGLTILGRVP
jgi:hypothetical protein